MSYVPCPGGLCLQVTTPPPTIEQSSAYQWFWIVLPLLWSLLTFMVTVYLPGPFDLVLTIFQDLVGIGKKYLKLQYLFFPIILLIISIFLIWNFRHKLTLCPFHANQRDDNVLAARVDDLESQVNSMRAQILQLNLSGDVRPSTTIEEEFHSASSHSDSRE